MNERRERREREGRDPRNEEGELGAIAQNEQQIEETLKEEQEHHEPRLTMHEMDVEVVGGVVVSQDVLRRVKGKCSKR